jgi:hypothetical protein
VSIRNVPAATLAALLRAKIELRIALVAVDPFAPGKLPAAVLADLLGERQAEL